MYLVSIKGMDGRDQKQSPFQYGQATESTTKKKGRVKGLGWLGWLREEGGGRR